MGRKPNYSFERREREKARALKKSDRQRAKREKTDLRRQADGDAETRNQASPLPPDAPSD